MLKSPLAAFAVLALACSPAYAQDVTFKTSGLKAGDTRTETGKNSANIDITMTNNGQAMPPMSQKTEETLEKTTEILAAEGGKPTKFLVRYKTLLQSQDSPMTGVQEQSDELAGKSFLLEKAGDAVTVTDDKGGAVDDLTADKVKNREGGLFDADTTRFRKILPDRPVKVGETIEVDKDKAGEVLNEDQDSLKVESMTLVLKETKSLDGVQVAVFDMTVKGAVEPQGANGPKIKMDLSGKLIIGVDTSWPHLIELSGPLSFKQNQGPMVVSAAGTTTISQKFTYTRKAREATKGF